MPTNREAPRGRHPMPIALFWVCVMLAGTVGCASAPGTQNAAAPMLGSSVPSAESVQAVIAQHVPQATVVGFFKKADNSYMVLSDRPAINYGGPYQLIKLESGDWYIELPPSTQSVGTEWFKVGK